MTSIDAENCCLRWTRSSSTIIKLMKKALRKLTTSATFSDIPYWTNSVLKWKTERDVESLGPTDIHECE